MIDLLTSLLADRLLVVAVVVTGITLTLRSRFLQVRHFLGMFGVLKRSFRHEGGKLSSFQALTMSLAGRVGSGNVAGVAVAIMAGGPGAVFWMWVAGLLGMATSYLECSLAQLYKRSQGDGTYRGGPAYYIERGLGRRPLALIFSVFLMLHSGLFMSAFQSFTVASSVQDAFHVSTATSGACMVLLLGIIVFGGVTRIATAADTVVPLMVLGYLGAAVFVVALNAPQIPEVLSLIVTNAFGVDQVIGGGLGAAIVSGTKRGLFSNEAGLGTAPNVAAVAATRHPATQGLLQALSVFIDTMVVCTSTAAIILFSGVYATDSGLNGVVLTQAALAGQVGAWGRPLVSVALVLFAFTSVMYSYYLAENCLAHLGAGGRASLFVFRACALAVVYWGTQQDLSTIFTMADLMMAALAGLNLYALARMSGTGLRLLRDYEEQRSAGAVDPVLRRSRYADLDLDRQAWPHD